MIAGEWDGGDVLTTHQEFNNTGSSRVTDKDGVSETHYHATHVAGTIMAGGVQSAAKGMAYNANLDAYDWDNDESEMATAAAEGLLISNHSYGYGAGWTWNGSAWVWYGDESISTEEDYQFGFYSSYCADLDNIANNAPNYLIVKSAGNDLGDGAGEPGHPQDGGVDGYDCISYKGNAKNILTVGAVEDVIGGYTQPSDVVLASFSSTGPCDDSRIKPDIVGNGVGLYSTYDDNNTAYNSISGTSMSSPNVTGSLLLLQEHYNESFGSYMKAASLKALAIHTADECGASEGPDYKFGWGLLNTATAANVISERNVQSYINEETYTGSTYTLDVLALGTEPLMVTIVWSDPAGTPVAAALDPTDIMLVNDLDMTITGDGGPYYPYKLTAANPSAAATKGDNDVDNVEKIYIANPTAGNYTINITHEGSITGGTQDFSIIVTGIAVSSDEPIVTTTTPSAVAQTTATVGGTVLNQGASALTERGVVWNLTGNPTIADHKIVEGSITVDAFTVPMTGLSPATTYYVKAFASNESGTGYGDELSFTTTCTPPVTQASNFIAPLVNENDVTLSWTSGGDHVIIIAKEGSPVDEDPFTGTSYAANTNFALGEDIGSGNIAVYSGTDETTIITGLDQSTEYYFAIYTYYDAEKCYNTTSPATINVTTTGYCLASGGGDEFINGISLGDILTSNTGANSYEDFTHLSTDLEQGNTYSLTVSNGTPYTGDDLGVWIDFNDNYSFDDAGENVICTTNDGAQGSYDLIIPEDANPGNHTMRIRIKYDGDDCGSPCGTTQYGEVEDYTVHILANKSDLMISSFSLESQTAEPLDTITVNINIQNISNNVDAGASSIYYYLSTDDVLDGSDEMIGSITTVPAISKEGETGIMTDYLIIDNCLAAGSYNIIAKADGEELINELDEDNNTYAASIEFIASLPTVSTDSVNSFGDGENIFVGGNVICNGGSVITERGIYFGTQSNPVNSGTKYLSSDDNSYFETYVFGVLPGTKYYSSTFATNSTGTGYGEVKEFVTENISITNISSNTAQVNWGHLGISATNYKLAYAIKSSSEYTYVTSTENNVTIVILPETIYIVQLKYYADGNWSNYMEPVEFTSLDGSQALANNVTITNIGSNVVDVNWDGSGADSYRVLYYETGTTNNQFITASTSPASIPVQPSTAYTVKVKTLVNGVWSSYSDPVEFTSLAGTQQIAANISISNVGSNAADVNWDGSGADSYRILYYVSGTTDNQFITASSSPASIPVQPATTYTVRVKTLVNGVWSSYSDPVEFTSLAGTQQIADNITISNIGSNTADVNWDGTGADSYRILYYETGTTDNQFITVSSSPASIPVQPSITYTVKVKTLVNGVWTSYSDPVEFNSLAGTQQIADNITISNIGSNTADVNWDGSGAEIYRILYFETGTTDNQFLSSSSSPATISVQPSTTYTVKVKSMISGVWSSYSIPVEFTSTASPAPPVNPDNRSEGGTMDTFKEEEIGFIYPNPVKEELNIQFMIENPETVTISIIDLNGRIVKQFEEQIAYYGQTERLNVEELNNGLYLVRVKSFTKIGTYRFLKE